MLCKFVHPTVLWQPSCCSACANSTVSMLWSSLSAAMVCCIERLHMCYVDASPTSHNTPTPQTTVHLIKGGINCLAGPCQESSLTPKMYLTSTTDRKGGFIVKDRDATHTHTCKREVQRPVKQKTAAISTTQCVPVLRRHAVVIFIL